MSSKANRNLRIWELRESGLVPASNSTIYGWIKDRGFPKPQKIGPRMSVWSEQAVRDWIESQSQEVEAA